MDRLTVHTGRVAPLRRSNVDTDQIIPARYLKRVARTGFADGLFAGWRADPGFMLNRPEHAGASILVTGPDFGTGSSREHAVWALQDAGFRVVVSDRFGDIFRGNAGKGGLLAAQVEPRVAAALMDATEADPTMEVTVDLLAREIRSAALVAPFAVDDYTRWRLLEGLDDIELTLRHEAEIAAFERRRAWWLPTTQPTSAAPR